MQSTKNSEIRKPITISLPKNLNDLLENELKRLNLKNRSQFIQQLLLDYFSQEEMLKTDTIFCGVILIRYLTERDTEQDIQQIQHLYHDIVLYTTHIHISKRECLEIIVVDGHGHSILELMNKLRPITNVKYVGSLLQPKK